MKLSEKEIASSLPEGTALLNDFSKNVSKIHNICSNLRERIEKEDFSTEKGVSLLELKNHLFLNYLSNLCLTSLLKLSGSKLEGHAAIDNLVESRVVLERIRPLEDKMKHQIEKYIKVATAGPSKEDGDQQVSRLDNIDVSSEEEDEQVDKGREKSDNKLYRIPKITQKHYPEETKEDARAKREKSRMLSSSMLQDALEEHADDPEVFHNNDTLKRKAIEKRKEIQRYEEDNFTRLTLSKKEKASLRQMSTHGSLSKELLSFRSLDGLGSAGKTGKGGGQKGSKKRKMGGKKGKGGFKKKKKH